ncbi:unnamed protein product [Gongylonema pulchrum]|uniref:Deoxyhypusine synthase n=1 Tax=Gongylonema pulchrum TaxID=637853 RepID=A0A183E0B3_9BILA|nr:unnamed protein product [Gongylonema pulchrum]
MSCPDFMRWVVERGAQNFGVYAEQCLGEAGKGLFAGTDFREGEILMCVPSSLIITAGVVADMAGYDGLFKRLILI